MLLAFVMALSSTAVAVKMLQDIDELRTRTGRITVGILIAQDLAVVPMILLDVSCRHRRVRRDRRRANPLCRSAFCLP